VFRSSIQADYKNMQKTGGMGIAMFSSKRE